jgi:ATP-dependent helicase/nuclease subunit A
MSPLGAIPDSVLREQRKASDPGASAWVAANAGSGKTHVLAQRVIRLLLQGEDPARILCITFTKAAAANMANRVFRTLSEWIALDDAALDRKIAEIGGEPGVVARTRARRLFALALETPGGLKVQTIHAFCTRLLHQFPFEADVAARFAVLDEASEHQLLNQITLAVMLEGANRRDSALGRALQTALTFAADQTLTDAIREAIGERDRILQWVETAGSVDAAIAQLSKQLGLKDDDSFESINERIFSESLIPTNEWSEIAAILAAGKSTDCNQAALFDSLQHLSGPERLSSYLLIFCTKTLTPRDRLVTNAIVRTSPGLVERLTAERNRICALLDLRNAADCRDRTRALVTLAHEIIARYRAEKDRRGLLDYDDLIDKTLALFRKSSAAWVLFKLDLGINHILIDEAQDTSPKQWEIIRTLVDEFAAGAGARPIKRTLFAVGDDKQSIFSFQGAAPEKFFDMQQHFGRQFRSAEVELRTVKLQTSFRSGAIVLQAVDRVFAQEAVYRSLTRDTGGMPPHIALPETAPGCVDIWPLISPDKKEPPLGWDAPFDAQTERSPKVLLAERIARNVRRWTEAGTRPGDVLILVRQRGALFEAIIHALKGQHVPVAGADRLVLAEHIAVMDLIVLADALLLPEDDLALATVLKSPLFGFTDDDLFRIAWNRGAKSLRAALLSRSAEEARFADAATEIEALTDQARRFSPFSFYARLLGPGGARRKFLSRIGPDANDAIDEFLNLALEYESREAATLQGFVSWLRAAEADIKRDMEQDRDEVRVMTVHGAKGLEAQIVVLADTTTKPTGYHSPHLIPLSVNGAEAIVWAGNKANDPAAVALARGDMLVASENEYRRLLYVAMTRAKQHLIICGVGGRKKDDGDVQMPEGCWYQLVRDSLITASAAPAYVEERDADDGEGRIWRFLKSLPATIQAGKDARKTPDEALPAWLARPAAPEPPRPTPISPSEAGDDEGPVGAAGAGVARRNAIRRGRLVHRLMQSLPEIAREHRMQAAYLYLAKAEKELDVRERETLLTQVLAILDDRRFAPLFAGGSRAEVPIVGQLRRDGRPPLAVSGQVDRLVVTPEAILIADYKTNHAPPDNLDRALAVYPHYARQLALYRALLAIVYPGRDVRAALLWTETPQLMEIPGHALDATLLPLTSA